MLGQSSSFRSENSGLQNALDQSSKVSKAAYEDAKHYVFMVKGAVNKACEKIIACRDEMRQFKITDASIVNKVQSQLMTVQTEFSKSVEQMSRDVEEKNRQVAKFNVTLFGRTKAGKSTLMEILTHGNGKSIGKGGQRTTLDVRSYEWKGLRVTDVPGIEAYGGEVDDAVAENAAKYADLILFMITAGQPENNEAEWLVKLKRKDKAVICICNYKSSIADERRLNRFLAHPEKIAEDMQINGIKAQFNEFIRKDLSNEYVEITVAHLWAKFLSMQPEYKDKSEALSQVSNFNAVEQAIIREIANNGLLYREKSYLAIVDNPLYEQMRQLLDFCSVSMSQYKVVNDKLNEFLKWKIEFNALSTKRMNDGVRSIFYRVRNSVANFVDDNLERSDISTRWQQHLKYFDLERSVSSLAEATYKEAENHINTLFTDLGEELRVNYTSTVKLGKSNYSIFNWKRGFGWASAVAGVGSVIGFLLLQSTPVGWICTGIGLLFAALGIFSDSREKKLREKRIELSGQLKEAIDKMERDVLDKVVAKAQENIEKLQRNAESKFRMMKNSMLTLANAEREIALGYNENHTKISKKLIQAILKSDARYAKFASAVCAVARIPSKFTVIIFDKDIGVDSIEMSSFVGKKLGCKEKVWFKKINMNQPKRMLVETLLRKFDIQTYLKFNDDRDNYAYISKKNYPLFIRDDINIVEQLAGIQLIQRG